MGYRQEGAEVVRRTLEEEPALEGRPVLCSCPRPEGGAPGLPQLPQLPQSARSPSCFPRGAGAGAHSPAAGARGTRLFRASVSSPVKRELELLVPLGASCGEAREALRPCRTLPQVLTVAGE